ncbi:MAG: PQQ-binding-like beta-propeller repeat protein [Prolixibacteraceae bacterium]|jgi:outer membrane protein assembly factor BamB|nr:PQQ-binding-like beta-propeller repeat protein [Prolixibacteraceae bacterium]MBT6767057.1 PQQ-binding-like beta-propeller repeat protein [Prolixibacteraceae bacterium]MBT6999764.1 PQQ-binding-like beta-propeller repeat protein [Prolixibacteraceae bacterium]MBT7393629.1 PQQ-binding-like beta-propeller repeat protein [Prolixibacteraceae bacterium]
MTNLKLFKLILLFLVINSTLFVQAQNWPNWRGPNGDGTSIETNLPTKWDSINNVVWKSPVPGVGYASPVIWEDKLFTATADLETQERILLCYDNRNGDLLWQKTVVTASLEGKHRDNSYASGTPATDGNLVYVSFLDGEDVVVAAYDFAGKQVWLKQPGKFSSPHGYSCSPALFEDKVIINGNSKEGGFLTALNKTDGKIIWKIPHNESSHSFTTPIFRKMAGKMQMIFGGNREIGSYNPNDGSRYWFVSGPSEDFTSTPVYNEKENLVIMSSAWPQRFLLAIKPDGSGDVTESHVVWKNKEGAVYVPSPITTGDYILTTMTNGNVHCIDAATGNILWVEKLGRQYSSPVLADGLVYMPNDEGVITVIKPGPTFETIAKNSIGERMNASPAISNGKIYLRGDKHLFCIGESDSKKSKSNKILPFSELKFTDVGTATKTGKTTIDNNEIEIVAGGADIWGTNDEFNFGYKKLIGDFDLSVQVLSLSKAHQYTKAGIMARADLSDNSRHVYFQIFPDNTPRNKNNGGCEFQYRTEKGGEMKAIYPNPETAGKDFDVNFPNTWIRLKRSGDVFESYMSSDNKTWKLFSTFTQKLHGELLVGLAVTSHSSDEFTKAGFANFQFK